MRRLLCRALGHDYRWVAANESLFGYWSAMRCLWCRDMRVVRQQMLGSGTGRVMLVEQTWVGA